jgi:hypothetical protein
VVIGHSDDSFFPAFPDPDVPTGNPLQGAVWQFRMDRSVWMISGPMPITAPATGRKTGTGDWTLPLFSYRGEF